MIVTQHTTSALDRANPDPGPRREGGIGEGSGSAFTPHKPGTGRHPRRPVEGPRRSRSDPAPHFTTQAWDRAPPPPSGHGPKAEPERSGSAFYDRVATRRTSDLTQGTSLAIIRPSKRPMREGPRPCRRS